MHELLHLLTNPAHWIFELITDLTFTALAYPIAKARVRAHDRRVHSVTPADLEQTRAVVAEWEREDDSY